MSINNDDLWDMDFDSFLSDFDCSDSATTDSQCLSTEGKIEVKILLLT